MNDTINTILKQEFNTDFINIKNKLSKTLKTYITSLNNIKLYIMEDRLTASFKTKNFVQANNIKIKN